MQHITSSFNKYLALCKLQIVSYHIEEFITYYLKIFQNFMFLTLFSSLKKKRKLASTEGCLRMVGCLCILHLVSSFLQ